MSEVSLTTRTSPHSHAKSSVSSMMLTVLVALIPAIVTYIIYFGFGILIQIVLSVTFALVLEAVTLKLLHKPVIFFIRDCTAVVTGVLFALCLSPVAPWWISLVGMFFAIVVAKHLYGGLGQNIFNPAMVGFAVVLISFPQSVSVWLAPDSVALHHWTFTENVNAVLFQQMPVTVDFDVLTEATPLDTIKNGIRQDLTMTEINTGSVFGKVGGLGWEWIALMYLLGGFLLIYKKIITWRVPVAVILATLLFSLPFYLFNQDHFISPLQHLMMGGLMLGAFFIATDPTSGCSTPKGQIIFGIGVAVMTVLIREFGNFPDGVAFGVLLMNLSAPLIDRLTIPPAYGQRNV